MAVRVQCPSCGRSLLARAETVGSRATCPSCLAEITVPQSGPAPEAVQAERPGPPQRGPRCPRCGRDVEPIWLTCPWCEEPLRGRRYDAYGRPDLDVRRDRKATGVVVIILAVLGGIGVAILGFSAFGMLSQGYFEPAIYLAVGLLFLAGLTTLIVFVRSGGNPGSAGFRRVAVGTLAMAGGIMAVTTCAGIALFVFLLVVCLASASRGY